MAESDEKLRTIKGKGLTESNIRPLTFGLLQQGAID